MRGNITDVNKQCAIYTLALRPAGTKGSAGTPASTPRKYVRGEENLGTFRPRSGSLLVEHEEQYNNHLHLADVRVVVVAVTDVVVVLLCVPHLSHTL